MLTYSDLIRTIIGSAVSAGALIVTVLFVINLFTLRRDIQSSRQATRTGVRKRSQLR